MKRRTLLLKWIPPVATVVVLPAHAMTTAGTLYSGSASSSSVFTILRDWMAFATLRANGAVPVTLQNLANNIRIVGVIDSVGPVFTLAVITSCGEINSGATARVSASSHSSISLKIDLFVDNNHEIISLSIPSSGSAISIPPLSTTCTLV